MINNQKGVIHLFLLLILLAGIIVGVYLVAFGDPLKLFPKAAPALPSAPETSFELELENNPNPPYPDDPTPDSIQLGNKFRVDIYARSDVDSANLFAAKLNFPADLIEVTEIDKREGVTFVKHWIENFYDNTKGEISIVGGVPPPGIKTDTSQIAYLMTSIIFKAKNEGNIKLDFTNDSAIYSSAGNINIISAKRGTNILIKPVPASTPTPTLPPAVSKTLSCTSVDVEDAILGKLPQGQVYTVESGAKVKLRTIFQSSSPTNQTTWETYLSGSLHQKAEQDANAVYEWQATNNLNKENLEFSIRPAIKKLGPPTEKDEGKDESKDTAKCPEVKIIVKTLATVQPTPSPKPYPTASTPPKVLRRDGDVNSDTKFTLVDMSSLLFQFDPGKKGVITEADLQADEVVNTFDYVKLINIQIDKGVIRGSNVGGTGGSKDVCPLPPVCKNGQQLITGDPKPGDPNKCPSYSCSGGDTPTSGVTRISNCMDITTPGNYTLDKDITSTSNSSCIYIHDVANVNLNCGGHTIIFTSNNPGVITLKAVQHFTIDSCTTRGAANASGRVLTITNSNDGLITHNRFADGAVVVEHTNNLQVTRNTFNQIYQQLYSNNNTIDGNTLTLTYPEAYGATMISSGYGSNNTITNNKIDGGSDGSIASNPHIGADDGIVIQQESNDIVQGNTIANVWDGAIETSGFIQNTKILNNNIKNTGVMGIGGWHVSSLLGNTIADNTVDNAPALFAFYTMNGFPLGQQNIYFKDNVFRNNKLTNQKTAYAIFPGKPSTFIHPLNQITSGNNPPAPADKFILSNNTFTNNDFGKTNPAPVVIPTSMVVDGGGNICSQQKAVPEDPLPLFKCN